MSMRIRPIKWIVFFSFFFFFNICYTAENQQNKTKQNTKKSIRNENERLDELNKQWSLYYSSSRILLNIIIIIFLLFF